MVKTGIFLPGENLINVQKHPPEMFLKIYFSKFRKIHRKTQTQSLQLC